MVMNDDNRIETECMSQSRPCFSVAMSVYGKDNSEWLDAALASVLRQTVPPSEIVMVVDGPIKDDIDRVLRKYHRLCTESACKLIEIRFAENRGLGNAMQIAVNSCTHELIARMDSDDIALPNRFELQLERFSGDQDLSICGGQIEEFFRDPESIVGKRIVPTEDVAIKEYMKRRCPFNHMTVMFRKHEVLSAGGYKEWFYNEDYFLWIRMATANCKFANLNKTLVKVRVSEDMYGRRGGIQYFKSEIGIQRLMLNNGIINRYVFLSNCIKRFILQVMLPNRVRGWVFRAFARSK